MPLTFKLSLPMSTNAIKAISTDMPTDQPDADNHLSRPSPKRLLQCVQSMIKTNHPHGLLLCSPQHQEEYYDPRVGTRKRVTIAAFWCTTASCCEHLDEVVLLNMVPESQRCSGSSYQPLTEQIMKSNYFHFTAQAPTFFLALLWKHGRNAKGQFRIKKVAH